MQIDGKNVHKQRYLIFETQNIFRLLLVMVKKLGKALVIIFASVTFLLVPVSLFYIGDSSTPPVFTLDLVGRFYDANFGNSTGFTFVQFVKGVGLMFTPAGWNNAFTGDVALGIMPTGTLMMILWYVSTGLAIVGIVLAFFRPRIAGIFFLLAGIAEVLLSLTWYFGLAPSHSGLKIFPVPLSALFFIVTAIIAFTTKKKESYYYSPGYSYGYGRR
ncbi:MAG: hypothetical protein ACTSO7_06780 [Candidatus Heimdallarchaeota archaeon]